MSSPMMLTSNSINLVTSQPLPEGANMAFACFATVAILFLALSSTVFYVSNPLRHPQQPKYVRSPSLRSLQEGMWSQCSGCIDSSDLSPTDLSLVYRGADPQLRHNARLLLEAFNYDAARLSEQERCSSSRASFSNGDWQDLLRTRSI